MNEVRCIVRCANVLGEGPFWDAARRRVWWFDIKARRLEWLTPSSGETGGFDLPVMASAGATRTDGRLLLATETGLQVFDPETGTLTLLWAVRFDPGFRSNEGKIDPSGRFWWSMMDDDEGRRPGAVFRTDSDTVTERVLDGIHIPNTLTCSIDGLNLHVADSRDQVIFRFAVDGGGRLSSRSVFAHTRGGRGAPDGSALDTEGCLWNAQWGAGRLVRYRPDGVIDAVVKMPVEQPSSCAFGGDGLRTLYVTSARAGLSDDQLTAAPLSGGLFAFEPTVGGYPLPPFRG